MAKKKTHPNIRTVEGSKEFLDTTERLRKEGYIPYNNFCMPKKVSRDREPDSQSWEDFIGSQLRVGSAGGFSSARRGIPSLYFSSGNESKSGVEDIGTDGLGYIEWGVGNLLPNVVALLTQMSPYTASGNKFNDDLLAGLGPQPMYDITQYIGGNITTKKIRYKDAGYYIRGRIADKRRELLRISSEFTPQDNGIDDGLEGKPFDMDDLFSKDDLDALKKSIREEIDSLEKDLEEWEKTNKEVQEFLDRNNLAHTWLSLVIDQMMFGISFPELTLNQLQQGADGKPVETSQWKPKVVGFSHRTCHTTRLERMDDNGVINYVYCSNRWLDSVIVQQQDLSNAQINAIPALNTNAPLVSLERFVRQARNSNVAVSKRPTRFICPSVYPTAGRPYYPTPAWYSIFGGDIYEYLSTIISDRFNRKKNSNIIGRVIYMNHEYLNTLSLQQDKDGNPRAIEDVRDQFYDEINSWLSNRNNAGQSLLAFTFQGSDGKEHKSFEVVEIAAANKGTVEANEKETAELAAVVFMSLGLDSRLLGSSPLSLVGSNGGTDIRERLLLRQILMSPTQNIMLKPLDVVSRFNGWDRHLVWEIKREVMTTLDRSKSGVIESETNQ